MYAVDLKTSVLGHYVTNLPSNCNVVVIVLLLKKKGIQKWLSALPLIAKDITTSNAFWTKNLSNTDLAMSAEMT
jgi:hypothetical protein